MIAMVVLCAVGGLVLVGRGVRTLVRGGPLVLRSGGRAWATAGGAAAFWLLIGAALLVAGLLRVGARSGVVGADAGFWLSFTPLALCAVALILFRPRRMH